MRILNRNQFLEQPSGIIYSEYRSSGMVKGLYEKDRSLENDWYYTDLMGEVEAEDSVEFHQVFEDAENGKEFLLDYECGSRDGCFDDEAMFMVYDKNDLTRLIHKLSGVLASYPNKE